MTRIVTWEMFTIDKTKNDIANVLNWSTFSHGKWYELIRLLYIKGYELIMTWLKNGINILLFLHSKWFEFIMIGLENGLSWPICLHVWSEIIMTFTMQMVWIDLDFDMTDGLNWLGFLHDKWSQLIRTLTYQMV